MRGVLCGGCFTASLLLIIATSGVAWALIAVPFVLAATALIVTFVLLTWTVVLLARIRARMLEWLCTIWVTVIVSLGLGRSSGTPDEALPALFIAALLYFGYCSCCGWAIVNYRGELNGMRRLKLIAACWFIPVGCLFAVLAACGVLGMIMEWSSSGRLHKAAWALTRFSLVALAVCLPGMIHFFRSVTRDEFGLLYRVSIWQALSVHEIMAEREDSLVGPPPTESRDEPAPEHPNHPQDEDEARS
jgi:hypothetical protein